MSDDLRPFVRRWPLLLVCAVAGAALALAASFVFPLRYSSTVRLLVTQSVAADVDPFTAMKSAERVAGNLAGLVHTSTFMEKILSSVPGFDRAYFPADDYDRRKLWSKTVETSVEPSTSFLTIVAFHPQASQANLLVSAAAKDLTTEATSFFGANVRAQQIDSPLNSRWFVRPRILRNGVYGGLAGFLVGLAWVLIRPRRKDLE